MPKTWIATEVNRESDSQIVQWERLANRKVAGDPQWREC